MPMGDNPQVSWCEIDHVKALKLFQIVALCLRALFITGDIHSCRLNATMGCMGEYVPPLAARNLITLGCGAP